MNKDGKNSEINVTEAILADIPDCLSEYLVMLKGMNQYQKGPKPIRISSRGLASRFLYLQWNIDYPRDYKDLFSTITRECNKVLMNFLELGKIDTKEKTHTFEIKKVSKDVDLLVLEFIPV